MNIIHLAFIMQKAPPDTLSDGAFFFGGRTETWTQTSEYTDYSQFSKLLPYRLGLCDHWWRMRGSNPTFRGWEPLVLTC